MITALVQFKLPQPVTRDKAREIFSGSAQQFQGVPGLIRKYYLLSQDGGSAGGVYLWRSREDAERLYSVEWKKSIQQKFGSQPTVTWFDSPVIVDNLAGSIQTDG